MKLENKQDKILKPKIANILHESNKQNIWF